MIIILMSLFQAKDGDWFILATNLAPCVGVRVHLWPNSAKSGGLLDFEMAAEVTTKMAEVPTGPTQRQVYTLISNLIPLEMAAALAMCSSGRIAGDGFLLVINYIVALLGGSEAVVLIFTVQLLL